MQGGSSYLRPRTCWKKSVRGPSVLPASPEDKAVVPLRIECTCSDIQVHSSDSRGNQTNMLLCFRADCPQNSRQPVLWLKISFDSSKKSNVAEMVSSYSRQTIDKSASTPRRQSNGSELHLGDKVRIACMAHPSRGTSSELHVCRPMSHVATSSCTASMLGRAEGCKSRQRSHNVLQSSIMGQALGHSIFNMRSSPLEEDPPSPSWCSTGPWETCLPVTTKCASRPMA
mmetsp:Transcript_11087/g.25418  ORF Transcript_11087/g.25418 Transcript_11087/m.25418 type:complete len:228 (-) Transcript_11087:1671-2354(-)